nr:zinc finger, CCHC-type [Tanacetum cinerariifolium]
MDEFISVFSIIDKLSPSWKDFKHMLQHNKDELSIVQLGIHFRIEKTLRIEERGKGKGKDNAGSSSVNMVEDDKNERNNKNSKENKRKFHDERYDSNKKPKMACLKCGKPDHFKNDCRVLKNNGASTFRSGQWKYVMYWMMKLLAGLTRVQLVMHVRIVIGAHSTDKQGAQLLIVIVLVLSRTWISDRIASLNGTTVKYVLEQDKAAFVRLIGVSVL